MEAHLQQVVHFVMLATIAIVWLRLSQCYVQTVHSVQLVLYLQQLVPQVTTAQPSLAHLSNALLVSIVLEEVNSTLNAKMVLIARLVHQRLLYVQVVHSVLDMQTTQT